MRVGPFMVPCYLEVEDGGEIVSAIPSVDHLRHARLADHGTELAFDASTPSLDGQWDREHPSLRVH